MNAAVQMEINLMKFANLLKKTPATAFRERISPILKSL